MDQTERLVFVKEHRMDSDLIYVLQDDKGLKRLVDGKPYEAFGFQPGMIVEAILRGRGCAGEEVSELLHPFYQIGCSYSFLVEVVKSLYINNLVTHFIIVSDKYGNRFRIKIDDRSVFKEKQIITCVLTEQKKGKLIFTIGTDII